MKVKKIPHLIDIIDQWKQGDKGIADLANCLDWPIGATQELFIRTGIANVDNTPNQTLTTDQILVSILWYIVNSQLSKTKGVKVGKRTNT
jgi:hypothetical protein